MISYYRLVRKEEIFSYLKGNFLETIRWQDQLKDKIQLCDYSIMTGHGDDIKNLSSGDMPPCFIVKDKSFFADLALSPLMLGSMIAAGAAASIIGGGIWGKKGVLTSVLNKDATKKSDKYLLVCNLDKLNAEEVEQILTAVGVLSKSLNKAESPNFDSLLETTYINSDSIIKISPEYIRGNFPLTYPEEMIYESIFVKHPLVGYEGMLVPLEKYYKFLSEQSFNEFLTILVKLGVKKVELVYSENKMIRNALDAYAGYKDITGVSATYKEENRTSIHSYWGMEFEGKHISPQDICNNFLDTYPFHRNNGTLKAMIEGIRSGNRNKVYTVERSFSGSYGLDIGSAGKVLGFNAGFDFNRETYQDEKSTFNVLY